MIGKFYLSFGYNNLNDNNYGIVIGDQYYTTVANNNITQNTIGLSIHDVSNSTSSNNTVRDNRVIGFSCYGVTGCRFYCNIVENNSEGIDLFGCKHNVFVNNLFMDNLALQVGLISTSDFNSFYHNTFIHSIVNQVYIWNSYNNVFDNGYPSGGNYWDDYAGEDL